jgi:hypothetical protein
MGKAKRFNLYDKAVSDSRKNVEFYGLERQKKSGITSSFRNQPASTQAGDSSSSSSSTSVGATTFTEIDLGTVSGSVNVDWDSGDKFRCVIDGNVTFSFINGPDTEGEYQQIILEVKQDATGGHTVSFADSFENDHAPLTALEAGAYNVWAFYQSGRSGTPIFSFNTYQTVALTYALSDELTPLSAASSTIPASVFRLPFPITLTGVRASLTTAGSGSVVRVDIHESGTTVLSTTLTIDAGEKTSTTAATPAVISDATLADDAEIELFMTARDSGNVATGLKVTLIGYIS